jgi:phage terminase large subunit-like protein
VQRFLKDVEEAKFEWNPERGYRIVKFFETVLRHWKGKWAGKPMILEPHQHFYLMQQFGWLRDDGLRRFRSSYKEVARKNAKTTECAGKALFLISKDEEQGAQVWVGATKEEQARILTNDAGQISQLSPVIRDRFNVFKHQNTVKRVVFPGTKSFIAPLGRDSKTQDGFDPHVGIIDEYHEHKTDDLLNVIESGMGARSQPMLDVITTAGFNKYGPCYALRKNCIDVLRGVKTDDSLLTMIFALDKKDDWQAEENWYKANPNLDVSVNMPYLRDRCQKAINEGSTKEVDFKTKNLNVWTDASDVWIQNDVWSRGGESPHNNNRWFAGFDLSSTRDYTSVAFINVDDAGFLNIYCWGFIPDDTKRERLKDEASELLDWIRDGWVITTPGNVVDYDFIEQFTKDKWAELGGLYGAADPWNAHQMLTHLQSEGLKIDMVRQSMAMLSEPAKFLEKKALQGKIRHGGNPALAWMVSNCIIKPDSKGNIWVDKEFESNKIDMVKAVIFALRAYISYEEEEQGLYIGMV